GTAYAKVSSLYSYLLYPSLGLLLPFLFVIFYPLLWTYCSCASTYPPSIHWQQPNKLPATASVSPIAPGFQDFIPDMIIAQPFTVGFAVPNRPLPDADAQPPAIVRMI